ncbi:MAG: hypothetical protein U0892_04220 [Pirellulales bacterium]
MHRLEEAPAVHSTPELKLAHCYRKQVPVVAAPAEPTRTTAPSLKASEHVPASSHGETPPQKVVNIFTKKPLTQSEHAERVAAKPPTTEAESAPIPKPMELKATGTDGPIEVPSVNQPHLTLVASAGTGSQSPSPKVSIPRVDATLPSHSQSTPSNHHPVAPLKQTESTATKPSNVAEAEATRYAEIDSPVHDGAGSASSRVVQNFDVVPYRPATAPFENHHGVLDVWAKNNIPNYVSRGINTPTVALTKTQHEATKQVYRAWLFEKTGKKVGGVIEWSKVSPREVQTLMNRMFDAANVPQAARDANMRAFNQYVYRN